MTTPSFRDVEQLSASLDGQLSRAEKARLENRFKTDLELAAVLEELRQARTILRRAPQRRAPRNFTLTPRMAGVRPPVPRAVPALSWASAVAMLFFLCTLGTNLLGRLSFGASAPMAAAPMGIGGGPAATEAPASASENSVLDTATPESVTWMAPQATSVPDERLVQPPGEPQPKRTPPVNLWPYLWLGLAALFILAALLVCWLSRRAFLRKNRGG